MAFGQRTIHPEQTLTGFRTSGINFSRGFANSRRHIPSRSRSRDNKSVFLLLTFSSILLSTIFLIHAGTQSYDAPAISWEINQERYGINAPADKEYFLNRLNNQQKRVFAGQVHYLLEVIRGSRKKLGDLESKQLAFTIVREARKANIDPLFVAAVIKSESTFKKHAVSPVGAKGLMQILPDTGRYVSLMQSERWKGEHQLNDPDTNIRLGIAYLKYLSNKFDGNTEHALIAYNWGPGNLSIALKKRSHIPTSTIRYARTIMRDHNKWKTEYDSKVSQFGYLDIVT